MKRVFTYTRGMREQETHYCPGCTHGIAHRLIMEVLEERGKLGNAIAVSPVGCSILAHEYFNVDTMEAPHGRAPAVASGIKRVHKDATVFTYQGDGDLASIGTNEIIHAAERGEKFCAFFINNAIYGMTGGQMAPTTLVGQKTTTSVEGRKVSQSGSPLRISEMIATVEGAVFVERVSLHSPVQVRRAKGAIEKAFWVQEEKLGFAFVEILSSCPTNWGMTPVESLKWVEENMVPYYSLGNFRIPKEVTK